MWKSICKTITMAEDKAFVLFTCQRCSQGLKMDDSMHSFSEHVSAELNLPVHSGPMDIDLESQTTSYDQFVPPCRLSDSRNGTSGFMVISDEDEVDLLSHTFQLKAAMFDLISGTSEIDHPLCEECTNCLIEAFEQQLVDVKKDFEDYTKYYENLQEDRIEPKIDELENELKDLNEEEKRLLAELDGLKQDEQATLNAIKQQQVLAEHLQKEGNTYWKEYVKHKREWLQAEDEGRSLQCRIDVADTQLKKLSSTNVFNATFHIWHKGHFGTINNFHLGTLPSAPVGWPEINTAWGQTALLFCALARKINLQFNMYRVVPYGSHSYIEVIGENKKFPLYGSGGTKYLWDTKFDTGMIAFLDCLQQFTEKVEELQKKQFKFPYKIVRGKIIDSENVQYSLRATIINEEQWTKGLKYMLTDLKWGLAWVASQFNSNGEEIPAIIQN